jgi:hypothetical protein
MSKRPVGSMISYCCCIVAGILGIGLCCFFGFGEVSSPGFYDISFVLIALLMVLLIAFGYRGLKERRKIGNEVWWQLLIIGLLGLGSLSFVAIFIFVCIALLSGGQTTF